MKVKKLLGRFRVDVNIVDFEGENSMFNFLVDDSV